MKRFRVLAQILISIFLGCNVSCHSTKGLRWAESRAPGIRVNQLGYLPQSSKIAALKLETQTPVEIILQQGETVLWRGESQPRGYDEASGDHIHWVDFSTFTGAGTGLKLVGAQTASFPFSIQSDLYDQLPYDALRYFYHNRSGIPIEQPYVAFTYTRPVGHLSDKRVECWNQDECQYALDVSGGWYDAGDHGKYVVNGGISAWTLLTLYERLLHLSKTAADWGDNTLNIPESGNGRPDLLDEARFEVEFLLKMQVPAGQPFEGMVHHKVHDNGWTSLAIEPPTFTDQRFLHPPSTAATLNMAAVAAQAARIFKDIDPAFSARCLLGARTAFAAAVKTPNKLAPALDKQGGGPYDDKFVDDEFFWATAELYITTGAEFYHQRLIASPYFSFFPTTLKNPDGSVDGDGVTSSMSWQFTAALGWISLTIVPNKLTAKEGKRWAAGIRSAADSALGCVEHEGYRLPMCTGINKKYPWGSNSFVLNNMVVLALAYDLSGVHKYARGVLEGMDYILGRNPLVQSYITGYGSVPLEHPHHRFWANSLNRDFPSPPPGAVSGGPNSSLQDPQTKKEGLSHALPPQKCFVDHIEAWSVNEVAINWNAPLAFCAVFLKEYARSCAAGLGEATICD